MTPRAQVAPVADGSGGWVVRDKARELLRQPLAQFRVSVLWKADVYRDAAERRELAADTLTLEEVASAFDEDLESRGEKLRFDLDRFEDPALQEALLLIYPEPAPRGALPSIYD